MNLFDYLLKRMRMSHIYQPVMIKTLLERGGKAYSDEIASVILSYDDSQIKYYAQVVNNMVGKVLRRNQVVYRNNQEWELLSFENYSEQERLELIQLCEQKISTFLANREKTFAHRDRSRRPISGSIRYQVLKRAKGRCELCGISAAERALEVDHIVPKSIGGEDSLHNYQALCFKCNTNKGNRDQTDFRGLQQKYSHREESCLFCELQQRKPLLENNLAFAIYDGYPVTEGHCLIIPKRHSSDWFQLEQAEFNAMNALVLGLEPLLKTKDPSISGFNIGSNAGKDAGQSIFHTHWHLIPRRVGDIDNPVGGVRNTIPGKGHY